MSRTKRASALDVALPDSIGRTAARELATNGITTLAHVASRSEDELLAIHGVGPKCVRLLSEALAERGRELSASTSGNAREREPRVRSSSATVTPRIFRMAMTDVHPAYVAKAERKGRSRAEVDRIIRWQTGYTQAQLRRHLTVRTTMADFFSAAPAPNPARDLVTGVVCGVRVEDVEDPIMREIRILDRLVDELARGKALDAILRKPPKAG
jgi:hypothetical protein